MSLFRNFSQRLAVVLRSGAPSTVKSPIVPDKYDVMPRQTAEHLIHQVKPVEISADKIGCDGGNGPLGHPMVYINLDNAEPQACGYCGIRFVKKTRSSSQADDRSDRNESTRL
ncbi:putative NADH dehydrogenase [Heterostelium album PN500]|uniref:Putative NADH dehydrogenase n=1 Tax=Heterostelium pallidum (strain ATCC 26659 / Pp 5 / PN500) TaxID=670386 RepID=D3AXJ1_HETP5|nr:putative NADH dehydrogenase [Heterostelium album PN500]EFA86260.1 putative NADH dehydrogenase [Heterostelium album PN500]|eukprot:XP_020438365.1 putative NADH dehydrogenase [Heterostelium album PN500]